MKPGSEHETGRSGTHHNVTLLRPMGKFSGALEITDMQSKERLVLTQIHPVISASCHFKKKKDADMNGKKVNRVWKLHHRRCIQCEGRTEVGVVSCFRNVNPEEFLLADFARHEERTASSLKEMEVTAKSYDHDVGRLDAMSRAMDVIRDVQAHNPSSFPLTERSILDVLLTYGTTAGKECDTNNTKQLWN